MKRKRPFLKYFLFIVALLLCTACEKDGHDYFIFINHSDSPVWVTPSPTDDDPKHFEPFLYDYQVEAKQSLEITPTSGLAWERSLYANSKLVISIYNKSISEKPKSESYEDFKQKHLLEEKWYTVEELNKLNWKINYYPEE